MKPETLTKRDVAITSHVDEDMRARAYELYEVRGRTDGHAEDDWLQAEGEVARSNEGRDRPASPINKVLLETPLTPWKRQFLRIHRSSAGPGLFL